MQKIIAGDQIIEENKIIEELIDFTQLQGVKLSSNSSQIEVLSPIYFKSCTFKKDVIGNLNSIKNNKNVHFTQPVVFENCTFEGEINFRETTFDQKLDFSNSVIRKKANFESMVCRSIALFQYTIFEGEIRMQNTYFQDHFSMKDAQTKDIFTLQNAVFLRDANFILSKHFGYFEISISRFEGLCTFNFAEFQDRLYISNNRFNSTFDFKGVTVNNGEIKGNIMNGPCTIIETKLTKQLSINDNKISNFKSTIDLLSVNSIDNKIIE